MKKAISFFILLLLFDFICHAAQPLPREKAFVFSAAITGPDSLLLNWQIASHYHLYQERFTFKILEPKTAKIVDINLPLAEVRQDSSLGTYKVYTGNLSIPVTFSLKPTSNSFIKMEVSYQGCSEEGYCYPPTGHEVTANFEKRTLSIDEKAVSMAAQQPITQAKPQHFIVMFFAFMGLGLLLSFTPCVLPMIPILSGIILGHGHHISTGKAFRLSLTYVLSMSVTYAIAGLFIGYLGGTLQALFQKNWVIFLFSFIYVLMALSMFGLYNLQPPQKLESKLANISAHQKTGHYLGVAIMGCIATLIISPCVTPALVTALAYLAQSGDMYLGAASLFAIGFGMGIPLLFIGTSAKLLPKTGHWMVTVKVFVGFLLLAMAIFMLSRVLSGSITLFLWAALLIGYAAYLAILGGHNKGTWTLIERGIGIVLFVYGIILMAGGLTGHTNPLQPLAKKESALSFIKITSLNDFIHAQALAKSLNKPIMLDFYADWCIACKEMDNTTLNDPVVRSSLEKWFLVRADITKNSALNKALMQKYNVIAPPTFLFFSPQGEEYTNARIIGTIDSKGFLQHLSQALGASVKKP